MSIAELIGETTDYDKKEALEERKPKSWCKRVSAFANGNGGSLIFGITDDDMSFTKLRATYKQRTGRTFEESDYESFGIVDDKEYSGGLINLLQAGTDFVINNSKSAWKKTEKGRIEMPDYPQRAVLEGLVNALIHRNYLEIGSEVHIDMFDDRVEIYSPGGMCDGSKVQERDLMRVTLRRRNPIIAYIFNRLKYMERRGSGFKKILSDYRTQPQFQENFEPEFYSDHDSFLLIIKNLNYSAEKTSDKKQAKKTSDKKQAKKTKENIQKIKLYLEQNGENR